MYLKPLMPEVASGLLIGVGVALMSTGINEIAKFFSSTTKLKRHGLEMFEIELVNPRRKVSSYRVSALIYNPGT